MIKLHIFHKWPKEWVVEKLESQRKSGSEIELTYNIQTKMCEFCGKRKIRKIR